MASTIESYYMDNPDARTAPKWVYRPEIPTKREVAGIVHGKKLQEPVELIPNKTKGPWKSKEKYLEAQYNLLRADATAPLRQAIEQVRCSPDRLESDNNRSLYIYEGVGLNKHDSQNSIVFTNIIRFTCAV